MKSTVLRIFPLRHVGCVHGVLRNGGFCRRADDGPQRVTVCSRFGLADSTGRRWCQSATDTLAGS